MSYSLDMRERVIKFVEEGGSKVKAAAIFGICRDTIYGWLRKKAEQGTLQDSPPKRGWKKLNPVVLLAYVLEHPDFTLAEYAKYFGASIPSVCLALRRLKITRKKRLLFIEKGMKRNVQYFWSR